MTTHKPKIEAFLVTSKDENLHDMRGVKLMEHHDPSCVSTHFRYEPLIRLSDYEELQAEVNQLRKLVSECDEYLDTDEDTSIHHGSFLHHKLSVASIPESKT